MKLSFVPQPQRCILLHADAARVNVDTPIILQMPETDLRLLRAAQRLFRRVEAITGPFALYSEGSFAPEYTMARAEGYLLRICENTVQMASQDARGLFYGMQTLSQWLDMPGHPALEINDWPDLALRSDYLDMRGIFPKFDRTLEYVAEMARYKLNTLVIEYEDKLPRQRPEFCAPADALTPEQHIQLLQTARDNFIDLIPLQQSFLTRFLATYHGIYNAKWTGGEEGRYDYYKVIGQLLPQVTRNQLTARLIEVMRRLEYAAPVNYTAFRGDFFPNSEVELACLRERVSKDYPNLRKAEQDLRALLPELLSPTMAELFFESRSYPNRLFQRELERILDVSLD